MPRRTNAPTREAHSKLQRWTDLIAALLARRLGATFADLARDVPAYADGLLDAHKDSVKRTFERDKDELRDFGVPIDTVTDATDSENTRYRLRATDFYLPFLALPGEPATRRGAGGEGLRALPTITLTPDDLDLVAQAVARLEQLGDPALAQDASSAANKLAFDLPLFRAASDVRLLDADADVDAKTFDVLGEALRRRKVVSFTYRKPGSDKVTERHVEPYGLFFVASHWYLAAHDRTRSEVRNFRVSRIAWPAMNRKKPNTHDYEIPPGFTLREHARARDAWELGDAAAVVAEVEFTGGGGAVMAAARAGEAVDGRPNVRRYPVRRVDAFARWLLSFAGDVRPLAPPELVELYRRGLADTLSLYGGTP